MVHAAERIGGDKPKISRIETGKLGVTKLELEALLALYGVKDPPLIFALDKLRATRREPGWWDPFGAILGPQLRVRLDIERDAERIMVFQPSLIHGLLQTSAYARAVSLGSERTATAEQLDSYVEMRLARQERVFGRASPPQCICILDEAALRRTIGGPAVMIEQLNHLLQVSRPPQVSLQVVPLAQGWHAGLDGAFTIYVYPNPMDLDVVVLDYLDGSVYLEEDRAVERYRLSFDDLRASALSSMQSLELISRIARDLEQM